MKVLLAEYATAHNPSLADEGAAMLGILKNSFTRCGYDVILPGTGDFGEEIRRLAPSCDMGLVIAPDHLLSRYTTLLEQYTNNIGCGSMNAAVCANKVRSAKILAANGIPVPGDTPAKGPHIVKPVMGCGAQGVRLTDAPPGKDEFAQEYIKGENYSVSIIGNRVVGEACLYFTGNPSLVLAVNRQVIRIDKNGLFTYEGGETPVHPEKEPEIREVAVKAAAVLGCQGYCGVDVVVSDKVYVVDVNPRITTSLVGISSCMEEEVADLLVQASRGTVPDQVTLNGSVRYDTHGKVTPQ